MAASRFGNLNIVTYLIQQDAEIFHWDKMEQDALFFAVYHGHFDVVKYLCRQNADLNHISLNGTTPRQIAIVLEHKEIIEYFDQTSPLDDKSCLIS